MSETPSFVVINKPHHRVEWDGRLRTFAVGEVIDNVTLDDLRAFPDRFRVATSEEARAYYDTHEAQLQALGQAPYAQNAALLAAQEAAMEEELTALQTRLARVKDRKALATAALETAAAAPARTRHDTRGLAEMTPAERAVANTAAAERQMGDQITPPVEGQPGSPTPGDASGDVNALGGQRTEAGKPRGR